MEVVVMNVAQQTAETNSAAHHARAGLGSTLFRVAWLAILLGFAMEALLLLFTAGFEILPGLGPMVAELIGKVSWSAIVCAGLASGRPPRRPARHSWDFWGSSLLPSPSTFLAPFSRE